MTICVTSAFGLLLHLEYQLLLSSTKENKMLEEIAITAGIALLVVIIKNLVYPTANQTDLDQEQW